MIFPFLSIIWSDRDFVSIPRGEARGYVQKGERTARFQPLPSPWGGRWHEPLAANDGIGVLVILRHSSILHSTFYIYHLSFAIAASARKREKRISEVVLD